MGDMSMKQYKKMMSNKPAEKKEHHNLATIMGSKSKALQKAKGRVNHIGGFDKNGDITHSGK